MENISQKKDLIVSKLSEYDYKYNINGTKLNIILPMLCYLSINFLPQKTKMSSHLTIGIRFLSIEYNYLIYGIFFYFLMTIVSQQIILYYLIFLYYLYLIICVVKLESMKVIIHKWLDENLIENS